MGPHAANAENPSDESPIVVLDVSAAAPDAAPGLVVEGLRAAVARGTAFSAVLLMPPAVGAEGRVDPGLANERVRSLTRLRPELRFHCRGLAFVVPLAVQEERARAIAAGDRLWGCPPFATDDFDQARAWAAARLGSADA